MVSSFADPTSRAEVLACVALGANLGDAKGAVQNAIASLRQLPQTRLMKCSSLYRTAPFEAQGPDFINAVVLLHTQLDPLVLLHALQSLETLQGRARPYKNAPRTLDLDVIFYGDLQMISAELTLPHPRWHERAFVLHPLAEVWPERVTAAQLQAVAQQPIEKLLN